MTLDSPTPRTDVDESLSVGQLAALAGVTVRTLHHYGDLGLLEPERGPNGYRIYTRQSVERLTRILYYRDLGFGLDDIAALVDGDQPAADHLQRQHDLLTERLVRIQAMVAAIEREMEAHVSGTNLTAAELLEIFGEDFDPAWQDEAEQRWGDTEAWKQSQQRTASFTTEDWKQVKEDTDAFNAKIAAAFRQGIQPGSDEANALAEEHRRQMNVFYDTDHEMQALVASLYDTDPRFQATYDDIEPGLGTWLRSAIEANAANQ